MITLRYLASDPELLRLVWESVGKPPHSHHNPFSFVA